MRASSPAFALVTRSIAIPRPRPKAVPNAPAEPETCRRPTLYSVDLEVVGPVDAQRRSTIPPPLPDRARQSRPRAATPRRSHPEMADAVFSALRDLTFFETAVEVASFGVVTAMRALPSLAGVAMLRDEEHGGYVVVYARGPRSHRIVRSRVPEDDPIVGLALVRGGPVSVEYGSDTPPPARHASFGEPWTALVAPIQLEDRCVGVLELIDPLDGRTLGESARHALSTITQHLALFLRGRPLVVRDAFAPEQVGLD
jgi:GAF domain-containing protein